MIIIGSDHGGYDLKTQLLQYFSDKGENVMDVGTLSGDAVDYPDIARDAVAKYAEIGAELIVLICGTGIGISMAANRFKGIRCALCADSFSARLAKEHNNANCLALGGRVIGKNLAIDIIESFRGAKFLGGRHQVRIDKLEI